MKYFLFQFLKVMSSNFSSRKFIALLTGLWVLHLLFWPLIACIYSFEADGALQLAAFSSLAANYFWAVVTLVLGYAGIQTAANFSSGALAKFEAVVSNATVASVSKTETITRTIQEAAEKFKGDPSYAPVKPDTEEAFR